MHQGIAAAGESGVALRLPPQSTPVSSGYPSDFVNGPVNSRDDFPFYNPAKRVENKAGMKLQSAWNLLGGHGH
jgi:hypothetical protein